MDHVINLREQQRVNDTPAGQKLRRYSTFFMGDGDAAREAVEEFGDDLQAKAAEVDVNALLHLKPPVTSQRRKAQLSINFHLALVVAAARGKRACV